MKKLKLFGKVVVVTALVSCAVHVALFFAGLPG